MKLLWTLLVVITTSLSNTDNQRRVTLIPSDDVVVITLGNVTFKCRPMDAQDNIQWLMNDSAALLNESIEMGNAVVKRVPFSDTIIVWLLELFNLTSKFNQTKIQCNFSTDIKSPPVMLFIQGKSACIQAIPIDIL